MEANETVLSGDLNGDDAPDFENNDENSYHVLVGSGTDLTAILDGFTITAGNANGSVYESNAGGLLNYTGSPLISRCRFVDNWAIDGAAISNWFDSSPVLQNCSFLGNVAIAYGGAIQSYSNCNVHAVNCVFVGNTGVRGGAVYQYQSDDTRFINCTFYGNSANYGGGLYMSSGTSALVNCVLWNNTDLSGDGESAQVYGGAPVLGFSCIQGLDEFTGNGNIGDDPLFIDPDGPDGVPGTQDDDLRLGPGSPCIDAADNDAVPADEFDLDGDGDTAEPIPLDLDGRSRFVDDPATDDTGSGTSPIVDMGSYEFQVEDASCEGDANGDGLVDPLDSGFVLARFGCDVGAGDPNCDAADMNGDGVVDPLDVGFVLARFGPCP